MKGNHAARHRQDDAVAGVVAGVLMLGAVVAFLGYMNVAWVPKWVEGREAVYATQLDTTMSDFADLTESQVARSATNRPYSSTFALGQRGIPFLGKGASSGELSVDSTPSLNVSQGSLPVLAGAGSLTLTTHTTYYPNMTERYTLGAIEKRQADGAWVDLRNLLRAERTTGGALLVTIQTLNITGAPQLVGGDTNAKATGTVTSIANATRAGGRVHMIVDNVASGGAWRSAMNRTLASGGLTGVYQDCSSPPASAHYCFPSAAVNNSATRAEIVLINVATGWTAQNATVAAVVTG